jgi:purine-binding chemotaxis protein CheW
MGIRLRFGMAERPYDDCACIIVININEHPVGLVVDRVLEVLDIQKGESDRFIQGIGKVGDRVNQLNSGSVHIHREARQGGCSREDHQGALRRL